MGVCVYVSVSVSVCVCVCVVAQGYQRFPLSKPDVGRKMDDPQSVVLRNGTTTKNNFNNVQITTLLCTCTVTV